MGSPLPAKPRFLVSLASAALVLVALLLSGCDMSGPQSTIRIDGPVARSQLHLFYVTLGVTAFIFVTVGGVLAYAQIRFRARPGEPEGDPPPQTHGHPLVEFSLIVASALLLVVIAVPTVRGIWYQEDTPDREGALEVKVTGYQWWFKFEYPGLGIVTANEMVIPTHRPVHLELRTMDVIHSFWVPKLAGKKDLIPNRANSMWLQADRADYFWAQCAEFCGESHANMKFRVVALDEPEFSAWVQRQQADARSVAGAAVARPQAQFVSAATAPASGVTEASSPFAWWQELQALPDPAAEDAVLIAQGRRLFTQKTCVACHAIRGHEAMGISGPDLTHFASRTTLAAAMMDNNAENLRRWLADPASIKPGNLMWRDGYLPNAIRLSPDELEALVAYLQSLK
jgi:cytochrome c oxidase subunit 2